MKNLLLAYASKYGSTQAYAQWIGEQLGCAPRPAKTVRSADLAACDGVIFGGGIYAGGIRGVELITRNAAALADKPIWVFTVGLADPADTQQFQPLLEKRFSPAQRERIDFFHLRGGMDYAKLSWAHRMMMGMMVRMVKSKPEGELTEQDRQLIATYGGKIDFVDPCTAGPLVAAVKARG